MSEKEKNGLIERERRKEGMKDRKNRGRKREKEQVNG